MLWGTTFGEFSDSTVTETQRRGDAEESGDSTLSARSTGRPAKQTDRAGGESAKTNRPQPIPACFLALVPCAAPSAPSRTAPSASRRLCGTVTGESVEIRVNRWNATHAPT